MRPDKPLVWLRGEVKTPPLSQEARIEVGTLLKVCRLIGELLRCSVMVSITCRSWRPINRQTFRRLQRGEALSMPSSRPMPSLGVRCHELRITDSRREWRLIYRVDEDAIVVGDVFPKTTPKTPARILEGCRRRFARYDEDGGSR